MLISPWFPKDTGIAVLRAFGRTSETVDGSAQADWIHRMVNVAFGRWITDFVMQGFECSESSAELLNRLKPLSRMDGLVSIDAIARALGTDSSAKATLADIVDEHANAGARLLGSLAEIDISTEAARAVALEWGNWPDAVSVSSLQDQITEKVQFVLDDGLVVRRAFARHLASQSQETAGSDGNKSPDFERVVELLRRAKPAIEASLRLPPEARPAGLLNLIQDIDRVLVSASSAS